MKISISQISIPQNYVLVLPDKEFESFQHNGEEVLKVGSVNVEQSASHYSVRGEVFGVPDRLVFNLDKINSNKIPAPNGMPFELVMHFFKSYFVENNQYRQSSCLFDTDIEVSVGDTVFFNYQEHYACYSEGRFVDTIEHGEMLLMRYDSLICCHGKCNQDGLVMLNGYTLVEPITIKDVFGSNLYGKGEFLIADMESYENITKKKRNIGFLRYAGRHCRGFLDFPEKKDYPREFLGGELVLYNPRIAPSLEFNLHQSHFNGAKLVKVHRRDIFCVLSDELKQELPNIVTNIHLNK